MNYFDPSRPQLANGVPQYVDETGTPVAALPGWNISPLDNARVRIMLSLATEPNNFRWFEKEINIYDLDYLWDDWLVDPERVMREHFSWKYSSKPKLASPAPSADLNAQTLRASLGL